MSFGNKERLATVQKLDCLDVLSRKFIRLMADKGLKLSLIEGGRATAMAESVTCRDSSPVIGICQRAKPEKNSRQVLFADALKIQDYWQNDMVVISGDNSNGAGWLGLVLPGHEKETPAFFHFEPGIIPMGEDRQRWQTWFALSYLCHSIFGQDAGVEYEEELKWQLVEKENFLGLAAEVTGLAEATDLSFSWVESCTGGMGARVTQTDGVVVYNEKAKEWLGESPVVDPYRSEVGKSQAERIREKLGTAIGIFVGGVLDDPDSRFPEVPLGTVTIIFDVKGKKHVLCLNMSEYVGYGRTEMKRLVVYKALLGLRTIILGNAHLEAVGD